MKRTADNRLTRVLVYTVAVILVLLPFHAFFTTWLGSSFGHIDAFRIWKELLLVPIGLGAIWLLLRDKKTLAWLRDTKVMYLLLGYLTVYIVASISAIIGHRVNASALIYGLLSNLRYLGFFIICLVLAARDRWLRTHWKIIILLPAVIVISFGLVQHFVLAPDFLRHFGYGPRTIAAFQTVDQKLQYIRVQSTLRGANPLGAYLAIIIALFASLTVSDKKRRSMWGLGIASTSIVLFYTYSRSAWIGATIAIFLILWWSIRQPHLKRIALISAAILLLLAASSVFVLRNNDSFQNAVFHTDEHSRSADSSNQDRASALQAGLKDVAHEPWGRGPGTAGPASVRNSHPSRISENYYLQLGEEVGILGLLLFIGINVLIAAALWKQADPLSLALLAVLVGLSAVNMLSHAWGDDTLGLIYFGLAGIAIGDGILRTNSEQNEKAKEKPKKRNNAGN